MGRWSNLQNKMLFCPQSISPARLTGAMTPVSATLAANEKRGSSHKRREGRRKLATKGTLASARSHLSHLVPIEPQTCGKTGRSATPRRQPRTSFRGAQEKTKQKKNKATNKKKKSSVRAGVRCSRRRAAKKAFWFFTRTVFFFATAVIQLKGDSVDGDLRGGRKRRRRQSDRLCSGNIQSPSKEASNGR